MAYVSLINGDTIQANRKPVAGTIPRGFMPYMYANDTAGYANAGRFLRNPIAKNAGLEIGDVILKINHRKVLDPSEVVKIVRANPLKEVVIKVERLYLDKNNKKNSKALNIKVIPNEEGTIGVGLGLLTSGEYEKPSRNPIIWFCQAALTLFEWTLAMLIGFGLMIMNLLGLSPSGSPRVNADDLHGIIAIVSVFAQALTIDPREILDNREL